MTRTTKRAGGRERRLEPQEHVVQVGGVRVVGPWPSAVGAMEWSMGRREERLARGEYPHHIRPRRPDDVQIETPEDFLKSRTDS